MHNMYIPVTCRDKHMTIQSWIWDIFKSYPLIAQSTLCYSGENATRETTFIDLGPVKAALVFFDACISLVGGFGRDGVL